MSVHSTHTHTQGLLFVVSDLLDFVPLQSLEGPQASLLVTRTLLWAPGIATGDKDATRGSWHRY